MLQCEITFKGLKYHKNLIIKIMQRKYQFEDEIFV